MTLNKKQLYDLEDKMTRYPEIMSVLLRAASHDPFGSNIPGETAMEFWNTLARNNVDHAQFLRIANRIRNPRTIDRILALLEYGYIEIYDGLTTKDIENSEALAVKDMVQKARAAGFKETTTIISPAHERDENGRALRKNLPPGYKMVNPIVSGDAYFPEVPSVVAAPVTRIILPGEDPSSNPKNSFWGFIMRCPVKA